MTYTQEEAKIWEKQNIHEKEEEINQKSRGYDETEEKDWEFLD